MAIRILIVDDEAPARRRLRALLQGESDCEVVAEAATGGAALEMIDRHSPDLLFLDIQMPGMDGLAVVRELDSREPPLIVFVTAYDQFAVEAFELCALDYLLKPFDRERFQKALERARGRLGSGGEPAADPGLRRLLELLQGGTARFLVKARGRMLLIKAEECDWLEAAGNYVELHVGGKAHLVRDTLQSLEQRLDPTQFVRIHRSRIVNLDRIREILPDAHGDFEVVLRDGTQLRMSRRYRSNLDALSQ